MGRKAPSVALDALVLDHLEPALLLALLEGGKFFRRAGDDLHVDLVGEFLRDVGRARGPGEFDAHAVDDRPWRAGRHVDAPPRIGRVGLEAELSKGRNVRQAGRTLLAGAGEPAGLSGTA